MRVPYRLSMLMLCAGTAATATVQATSSYIPRYDHVVVVIMSNKSYGDVYTNFSAPYINALIVQGASFTSSHAVADIAQPNYWALFSGSIQNSNGAIATCPNSFTGSNLGRQLLDAGLSFAQYSEGLGTIGNTTCGAGLYTRTHNPAPDFADLPNTVNHDYTDFAGALSSATLPTVSFVVPNLCNDMHGAFTSCGTGTDLVALGDQWLSMNMPQYLTSSSAQNGLLIVTWDESGGSSAATAIPTIFFGPLVRPGVVSPAAINHYSVLRTLEDMYGLTPLGSAATAAPITDVWDLIFENRFE